MTGLVISQFMPIIKPGWMATKSNQDYEKYKVSIKGMAFITNHLLFADISVNWGGGGGASAAFRNKDS